jgi:3'-5' exoribonuclease
MEPQEKNPYEKCVYVSDLRIGAMPEGATGEIRDWFLLTRMDLRTNPRGTSLVLAFADKTGEIPGIWWDADFTSTAARVGDVCRVRAIIGEFNAKPQLNVNAIWKPPPAGLVRAPGPEYFFKASKHDPEEMYEAICGIARGSTTGGIQLLLDAVLAAAEMRPRLLRAPAAKTYHHAYLSGLLEHILSLMQAALALREHYPFDLPIVLAACVLHDIGKCWELDWERGTRYSVIGTLHGHVCIGFSLVDRLCDQLEVDPAVHRHLLHLIASHHGLKENGAPVEPATREALIFHTLDKLDANLAALDAALDAPGNEDPDWTPYIPALKARYLKPDRKGDDDERNDTD